MIRPLAVAVALLCLAPVGAIAQSAQQVRPVASSTHGPWMVEWIGAGEAVQHCRLIRRTRSAAETQTMLLGDRKFEILRVHSERWSFPQKRRLEVTLTGADGTAAPAPVAASGGPHLADMILAQDGGPLPAAFAVPHIDVAIDGASVRVPLDGLAPAKAAYDACMAGIGRAPPTWTAQEIDVLVKAKPRCSNDRKGRLVCEVEE